MGDGDYMYAFQQIVMPIAQEFNPDLVIGMQTIFLCPGIKRKIWVLMHFSRLWL